MSACSEAIWDHPRVCGENSPPRSSSGSSKGSPPRMRGELARVRDHPLQAGITPAYAGRTKTAAASSERAGGSPPRMRGEHWRPQWRGGPERITPAYAGRTGSWNRAVVRQGDHPRVCGENLPPQIANLLVQGSPPRMRGELMSSGVPVLQFRITPAYAGRTSRRSPSSRWNRDHPRVCGENDFLADRHTIVDGSPPRMRGERWSPTMATAPAGITPAYAGRTGARSRTRRR